MLLCARLLKCGGTEVESARSELRSLAKPLDEHWTSYSQRQLESLWHLRQLKTFTTADGRRERGGTGEASFPTSPPPAEDDLLGSFSSPLGDGRTAVAASFLQCSDAESL